MCQRKILFLLGNRAKVTHPPPMFKGLMNPFWQQSILVNIVQAQSELSTDLASLDLLDSQLSCESRYTGTGDKTYFNDEGNNCCGE